MDSKRILYIEAGNAIENVYQEAWDKDKTLLIANYKLPDLKGMDIGGELDALCFMDGKLLAFELKSYGSKVSSPKPNHLAQASFYSAVLGLPIHIVYQSREVANWYYDKQKQELQSELINQEFGVEYSRDSLYPYILEAAKSEVYEVSGVLPPRNPDFRKTVECKFCPYIPVCWEGKQATIEESTSKMQEILNPEAEEIADNLFDTLEERRKRILLDIAKKGTPRAREVLNYKNGSIDIDPNILPDTI